MEASTFTLADFNRALSMLPWPQPIHYQGAARNMRDVVAHQVVQEWRKRERAPCAQANDLVPLVTQLIQIYVANHVECPKRNAALALMAHARVIHGDLRIVNGRVPTFPSLFSERNDRVASPIEVDLAKYHEADSAA